MDTLGNVAASAGQWIGYVVWTLLSLVSLFGILISLPGGWVALALAVLYDLFYGFSSIGIPSLAVFLGLMIAAEALEAVLGTVYVAKKGATGWGMAGAFVGGIAGAVVGSSAVPIAGTILGSFAGAFGGAVAGEYYRDQQLEPSVRIGVHATIGRLLSITAKFALALAGVVVVIVAGTPGR